ncbi:NAD(P)H-dependent oxidoreductase [Candidatus Peregrinibacteria bacterium]|nr:NAD(P)H-dependent oxidoreductase [Candidatus Peregrinibacteria bacterium]
MDSFLTGLSWRFATKIFDPKKKVSDGDLEKIIDAIRFAPSSFGLQPYHIHVVSDMETRKKLREAAWNQTQITDASHLFVFAARNDTSEKRIDEYFEVASGGDASVLEKLKDYKAYQQGFFKDMPKEKQMTWAQRQAYIALGFAMAACAELKIDSCPMEGFEPEKVNEILGIPSHMTATALLTIGYRKEGPARPKVRFSEKDLFTKM